VTNEFTNNINILGVDDEDRNLRLIEAILTPHGYNVISAEDGPQALKIVEEDQIDVILLDIMMPGLDGYQVCRQLKENKRFAHIPVILVTSLNDREERIKGIAAGANDYLTKPIDNDEIILRVRNAARLKKLYDQTMDDYKKLKELEKMRDNLIHMIIHDLRSPLSGLIGHLDLLKMSLNNDPLTGTQENYLAAASRNGKTIKDMINTLLDVNKMEEKRLKLSKSICRINEIVEDSVQMLSALAENIEINIQEQERDLECNCDKDLIKRIVINLLSNAIKFTPEGGKITITTNIIDEKLFRMQVKDTGPGIAPEYHEMIFEKFGQVEMRKNRVKHSTGLGLTFCKLAVEAHNGRIGLESKKGKGSTFWFEIPIEGI